MKIIQIKSMPEPKIIKELYSLNQDNVPAPWKPIYRNRIRRVNQTQ